MDFESQFEETEVDKVRKQVLQNIQMMAQSWPDMVALYNGMVKQLTDTGWTEIAARTLVLSNATATNYAIAVNIPEDYLNDGGTDA